MCVFFGVFCVFFGVFLYFSSGFYVFLLLFCLFWEKVSGLDGTAFYQCVFIILTSVRAAANQRDPVVGLHDERLFVLPVRSLGRPLQHHHRLQQLSGRAAVL